MTPDIAPLLSDEQIVSAFSKVDWDFTTAKTSSYTHSFHPYPAKFIPQISDTLIEFLTQPGDTVADIFCGSGTTLVEAVRKGRNALGIDANPLATLIARVKCRSLNCVERSMVIEAATLASELVDKFYEIGDEILAYDKFQMDLFSPQPTLPPIKDLDFWFPKAAQNELSFIKQIIDICLVEGVREFLQVAFSSIIVNVSLQDSDTRYTRRDKGLKKKDTIRKWKSRLNDMLNALQEFDAVESRGELRTMAADSRSIQEVTPNSVDLVVTSPPYPNAYSYHLYHRFRMEWLGFDQPRFKAEEIGSHRKYSAKGEKGANANTFRNEMTDVLCGVVQMLKPSKICVFVVGDSIIRGEKIDNAEIIRSAGKNVGFRHLVTLNRNIHSGRKAFNPSVGSIKQEHLVFLRKI